MNKLIVLSVAFVVLSACTISHIEKEGFSASNYSLGWERKDVDLRIKNQAGLDAKVKIGESTGKEAMNKSIDKIIDGLERVRP